MEKQKCLIHRFCFYIDFSLSQSQINFHVMKAMFSSFHGTSRNIAVISLYLLSFISDVFGASTNGELFMRTSASTVNSTTGVNCLSVSHCAILCMADDNCGQAVFHTGEHSGTCFNSPTKGLLHPGKCEPTDPDLVGNFTYYSTIYFHTFILRFGYLFLYKVIYRI